MIQPIRTGTLRLQRDKARLFVNVTETRTESGPSAELILPGQMTASDFRVQNSKRCVSRLRNIRCLRLPAGMDSDSLSSCSDMLGTRYVGPSLPVRYYRGPWCPTQQHSFIRSGASVYKYPVLQIPLPFSPSLAGTVPRCSSRSSNSGTNLHIPTRRSPSAASVTQATLETPPLLHAIESSLASNNITYIPSCR